MRGREPEILLDKQGFQVVRGNSTGANAVPKSLISGDYADTESVTKEAGPAMESFLQTFLGAEIVKTFAFRVRPLFEIESMLRLADLISYSRSGAATHNFPLSQGARMPKFPNQSKEYTQVCR